MAEDFGTNGLTMDLIGLARSVDSQQLPEWVVRRAKHCVLDTLGVMLLGSAARPVNSLTSVLLQPGGDGPVTVMIDGFPRTGPVDAALINGTAAHTMDFDDAGAGGHISGALVPAALAFAELADVSGSAFLSGLIAGYETSFRLSKLLSESCYERGFHSSPLVGPFAAVVAGAHMLGLSTEQWEMALGITGSLSSGLRSNFGTMVKGLHSGHGASNGVLACLLAQDDYTGAARVLETTAGFMAAHTGEPVESMVIEPLGEPYALEVMVFKGNAACSSTHSSTDGLRQLIHEAGIPVDEVAHIHLRVPTVAMQSCGNMSPSTIFEIKFSVRFMAAAGALGYDTAEGFFEDDAICDDPQINALMEKIEIELFPDVHHGGLNEITVTLADGSVRTLRRNSITVRSDEREERTFVTEKFQRCAGKVLGDRTVSIQERIERLEEERSMRSLIRDIAAR